MDTAALKSLISMPDLVRRLGFEPDARGYIRCPFHEEKTASLRIYTQPGGGWHCFGCGKGGDQIDFIRELAGCDFRAAVRTLAGLAGVDSARPEPAISVQRRQAEQNRKRREQIRIEDDLCALMAEERRLERIIDQVQNLTSMDQFTDEMIEAYDLLPLVQERIERLEDERRRHGQR